MAETFRVGAFGYPHSLLEKELIRCPKQLVKRYCSVAVLAKTVPLIVLACITPTVLSGEAFVRILTPNEGAKLTA
ncbi:MAG: hypothetical protein ACREBC_38145, partial [Pyrinomonadaceae bacterium]